MHEDDLDRLPAMWARAEMRRALGVAMKTPETWSV